LNEGGFYLEKLIKQMKSKKFIGQLLDKPTISDDLQRKT